MRDQRQRHAHQPRQSAQQQHQLVVSLFTAAATATSTPAGERTSDCRSATPSRRCPSSTARSRGRDAAAPPASSRTASPPPAPSRASAAP
ncbi:hypothetical protein ON010_g18888 [Phytophthora cinnamomi]|nr:hypothetical protein ON010_g18888 [Phytophthora cinnamomi]